MKPTLLLLTILWLAACSPSLPYKTAPLPAGTLLYIKPVSMQGTPASQIEIDFTAQLTHNDSATAVINFSLFTAKPVSKINRLLLTNGSAVVSETEQIQKLFAEQQGNRWVSRFTAKISINEFKSIINSPSLELMAYTNTADYTYKFEKSWTEKSQKIGDYLMANQ